jgi:hypothetical protein
VADGDVPAILAAIHEGLSDDGVYVDPSLAGQVSDAQVSDLADNVAALDAAGRPTFVVLYPLVDGDPFAANPQDLLTRLHAAYPEAGEYIAPSRSVQYGGDGVTLAARAYDVPTLPEGEVYDDALSVLSYEQQPTLGDAAVRTTDLMLQPPAKVAKLVEQLRADSPYSSGDDSDDDGGGGSATVLVVVVVVLAAVGGAGWAWLRRRRATTPQTATTFTLPASAIDRIRDAHDRRLEGEARDELLALGEALDETEIAPRHDRDAWQAALDQYDAARRVLGTDDKDKDPEVLDVVGALVLTRRGRKALAAAVAGKPWRPETGCYLNPLHGPAVAQRRLRSAAGESEQEVPVCAKCRADLTAGRTPDVLDVEHRGKPRHYFETGVEPWAGTGYGALEPDLVRALTRSGR